MTGKELLDVVYDILAQNPVTTDDRDKVTNLLEHIDYDHHKIVIGNMDLRLYDHEEEA